MSTTPSLASLLQQDISIVTVKELRYQGKLYSYDTAKLTITLQDGKFDLNLLLEFNPDSYSPSLSVVSEATTP